MCLRDRCASSQAHDAAVLRAVGAQVTCELACVDIADCYGFRLNQVITQALRASEVRRYQWQIFDDEARGIDLARFNVLRINAVVANVWIGQGDDLLEIS
jgi:hypothetical protein